MAQHGGSGKSTCNVMDAIMYAYEHDNMNIFVAGIHMKHAAQLFKIGIRLLELHIIPHDDITHRLEIRMLNGSRVRFVSMQSHVIPRGISNYKVFYD